MRTTNVCVLIPLLILFCSQTILSQKTEPYVFDTPQKQLIENFIKTASGVYNNEAQADTAKSPLLRLSEIRAFQIWTHKKDEYWMSIGWYQPGVPEQPMGEKIFHLQSASNDTIWVDCYSWENLNNEDLLLQWKEKSPYKKQTIAQLQNDGCKNFITKAENGNYVFNTLDGQVCKFSNALAPFDGLFFRFVFNGSSMNIYDDNYKGNDILFHYREAPMLMNRISEEEANDTPSLSNPEQSQTGVLLKKGDKVDLFSVEDVKGNKVVLSKILKEKNVLLVFLRHAWCPVCNYRTHELITNYEALKAAGYEVVVVYESNKKSLEPYTMDNKLPYIVIADPEGILYESYKVERSMEKMQNSRTNKKTMEHYKKGMELFGDKKYDKTQKEEQSTIIPADFVISKDKKIEKAYYGQFIGDHLPVDVLLDKTNSGKASGTPSNNRF